jgi:hypothetical protein
LAGRLLWVLVMSLVMVVVLCFWRRMVASSLPRRRGEAVERLAGLAAQAQMLDNGGLQLRLGPVTSANLTNAPALWQAGHASVSSPVAPERGRQIFCGKRSSRRSGLVRPRARRAPPRRIVEHLLKRPNRNAQQPADLDGGDFASGSGVVCRVTAQSEITLSGLRDRDGQGGIFAHARRSFSGLNL